MNKVQPEVEAAPTLGWLADLEKRKDNVRGKLAHEIGSGAPCNNCARCSGLDLHFWRKACRICKCRGDQHDCKDDDLAGFMQFEILGQKRSTPAYVNIKTIPERVDWAPPNIDSELASEYMNELEMDNIPITGSEAATKRKIRLNYQVPMHDLDPLLCHNLSENEAKQLINYVGQIKENNVGQGIVVRVEDVVKLPRETNSDTCVHDDSSINLIPIPDAIKRDKILSFIMNSIVIQNVIQRPISVQPYSNLTLSHQPLVSDYNENGYLSSKDKRMLENIGIDRIGLQSSIINGRIYDKLFAKLDACKIRYSQCCLLQPLKEFRSIFNDGNDRSFNNNVANFASALEMESPVEVHVKISGLFESFQIEKPFIRNGFKANDQSEPEPIYENLVISNDLNKCENLTLACKMCNQIIPVGTVAIKAQRAGNKVAWHPRCFTCFKCGDLLADLIYFYHEGDGNIYCGRDLANVLNFDRCGACDEIIWSKEYTSAEENCYHIKHFCCYRCDIPLAGKKYTPFKNMPLCLDCYDKYYAEKCQNCRGTICSDEEAVRWQKCHWHKTCFNCAGAHCGKSLIGRRFCIKFDLPFCSAECIACNLN